MKWWSLSVGLLLAAVTATTGNAQSGTRSYYDFDYTDAEVVSDPAVDQPTSLEGSYSAEPGEFPVSTYGGTAYPGYDASGPYGYSYGKGCCRPRHPYSLGLWSGFCNRGCGCNKPLLPKLGCGCRKSFKAPCGCGTPAPAPCHSCRPKLHLPKLNLKWLWSCPGKCSSCSTCAPKPACGCGHKKPFHFGFFGLGKKHFGCGHGCGCNAGYGYGYGYGAYGGGTVVSDSVISNSVVDGRESVLSEGGMYGNAEPIRVEPQPPAPIEVEEAPAPIDPPPSDRSAWRLLPKKFRMLPASWTNRHNRGEPTPATAEDVPGGFEYFDVN